MSLLLLLNATPTTGTSGLYAHSFPGIRPSARFDDLPWVSITIAEAASRTGSFSNIVTAALEPEEISASNPLTRDITVTGARLASGWYRITFTDAAGETEVLDPLFAGPGVRPTVAEVAALMPDRTTVDGGAEARTFNTETSPTGTEVDGLISMVLDSVDPRVSAGAAPEIVRAARHVVTLQTAILVESGNWGDQVEVNESRVALWERLLAAHDATLDAASRDDTAGHARFGTITVASPTMTGQCGWYCTEELIP